MTYFVDPSHKYQESPQACVHVMAEEGIVAPTPTEVVACRSFPTFSLKEQGHPLSQARARVIHPAGPPAEEPVAPTVEEPASPPTEELVGEFFQMVPKKAIWFKSRYPTKEDITIYEYTSEKLDLELE